MSQPLLTIPHNAEQLLPHKGRMCCIDNLIALDEQEATAEVLLHPEHILLNKQGVLDPCGFIELAAQTAGAMQGAQIIINGVVPTLAILAGIQNFVVQADAFVGDNLKIKVAIIGELDGMSSLSFNVERDNELLATGRLKVFMPKTTMLSPAELSANQ